MDYKRDEKRNVWNIIWTSRLHVTGYMCTCTGRCSVGGLLKKEKVYRLLLELGVVRYHDSEFALHVINYY